MTQPYDPTQRVSLDGQRLVKNLHENLDRILPPEAKAVFILIEDPVNKGVLISIDKVPQGQDARLLYLGLGLIRDRVVEIGKKIGEFLKGLEPGNQNPN